MHIKFYKLFSIIKENQYENSIMFHIFFIIQKKISKHYIWHRNNISVWLIKKLEF